MSCTRLLAVLCVIPLVWAGDIKFYINGNRMMSSEDGGYHVYEYGLNELVTFKCEGGVGIFYPNILATKTILSSAISLEIQLTMKPQYHMKYVTCYKWFSEFGDHVTVQLVYKPDDDTNTIRVNDLMVRPDGDGIVRYYYYGDRPLNVKCGSYSLPLITVLSEFGDRSDAEIVCDTIHQFSVLPRRVPGKLTKVKLLKKVANNGLDISGLSDNKVTLQVFKSNTVRLIYYEYSDGDEVELKCTEHASGKNLTWVSYDGVPHTFGLFKKRLEKEHDGLLLLCIDSKNMKVSNVRFHYVPRTDDFFSEITDTLSSDVQTSETKKSEADNFMSVMAERFNGLTFDQRRTAMIQLLQVFENIK